MTGVFPASGNEETKTHSLKLPTRNISFDLDGRLPFFWFLRPPLGLAHRDGDVGASSGLGDSAKRVPEGRWQAGGKCQHRRRRGCPLAALCGLLVHPRQTSNPTLDLADEKKIEQSLLLFFFFFQEMDPGSPGSASLLVFFLFKQTAWLLRSSKSH